MNERRALMFSAAIALAMGAIGVTLALATGSRAILVDGLFNLTYFVIALVTVRVAELAVRPDTPEFPFGHAYFESLVNAGKGLLILGISAVALIDSMVTLATGGRDIVAGLAIAYAVSATAICTATAWMLRRALARNPSPLLEADVANWVLNAIISATVLGAFCLVPLLDHTSHRQWAVYVDPLLVAVVILVFLGVPIRIATRAVLELLNRAPPENVAAPVRAAVHAALADLPVRDVHMRMVRPGRVLYLVVHAVLPDDFEVNRLATLDRARERLEQTVRDVHPHAVVDAMFTADPRWAQPGEATATGDLTPDILPPSSRRSKQ